MKFGTDGVRGVALVELTTCVHRGTRGRLRRVCIGGDRWLIGRDPRESGPELEAALADGLCVCGVDVELLGVVSTPALAALAARKAFPRR